MEKKKVVIVKLGTKSVWANGWVDIVARHCADLRRMGYGVIIISSGAIEAGMRRIEDKYPQRSRNDVEQMYTKRAFSGLGTTLLFRIWDRAFAHYGLIPVPLLITHNDFDSAKLIRQDILEYVQTGDGIIIANENDLVRDDEIHFGKCGLGENDKLTYAMVALARQISKIEVAAVFFATHKGGYYTADPANAGAVLISRMSWEEYPDKDAVTYFMQPFLDPEHRSGNNIDAKVHASFACSHFQKVPLVAIAQPDQLYAFVTRDNAFIGTQFTE